MASVPPTLAAVIAQSPLVNTMKAEDLNNALRKEASLYAGVFSPFFSSQIRVLNYYPVQIAVVQVSSAAYLAKTLGPLKADYNACLAKGKGTDCSSQLSALNAKKEAMFVFFFV